MDRMAKAKLVRVIEDLEKLHKEILADGFDDNSFLDGYADGLSTAIRLAKRRLNGSNTA